MKKQLESNYLIIILISIVILLQIFTIISVSTSLNTIMENQVNDNNSHAEILNKLEQEFGEQTPN